MSDLNTPTKFSQQVVTWLIVAGSIFSLAAGCSLPNLFNPNQNQKVATLGVIKRDPSVKSNEFGFVNKTKIANKDSDPQGLNNSKVVEFNQVDKDTIYVLTENTGLLKTTDGGREWKLLPISSTNTTNETELQTSVNNTFSVTNYDLEVSGNTILLSGSSSDTKGVIYKGSKDADIFEKIYTGIELKNPVRDVKVSKKDSSIIFATLNNSVISSRDGGKTWQNIFDTQNTINDFGYVTLDGMERLYILTNNGSIFVQSSDSTDTSPNFTPFSLKTNKSSVTNAYKLLQQDNTIIVFTNTAMYSFTAFDTENLTLINLPIDKQNYKVTAAYLKNNRLIVGIAGKLYESSNLGGTWKSENDLTIPSEAGNISAIQVDNNDSAVIYLGLN
jgi:photosystem II stability/assembly factor-like uncharacterized protein